MSETVDNHIVQITLDNKEFEANVTATIDSLTKLQTALQQTDGTKSMENLNEAANKVDLTNLQEGFVNSQTAAVTFGNLAADAIKSVIKEVESLSSKLTSTFVTGPLSKGFSVYQDLMQSTKVILSNYGDTENLESVTAALDELEEYANQTTFSFAQMTTGISKFSAAGVDLEDSVDTMRGLANAAALVGANNTKLYSAFYNMSQSMTTGYLSYLDWKSIANAGIGNKEMREAFVKTAIAMGKFTEGSEEAQAAYSNFNNSLTEYKWLTNDVITETMNIYAMDMTKATKVVDEATGAITYFNDEGEEIEEWMYDLAERANSAATEVKTFSDMWDVLLETVESSWSKTFKIIFGDLEEATDFWTDINDMLATPIIRLNDLRNEMLTCWKEWGGYGYMIAAVKNAVDSVMTFWNALADAWERVFPEFGKSLALATYHIQVFTEALGFSGESYNGLVDIISGGLRVFKALLKVFSFIVKVIASIVIVSVSLYKTFLVLIAMITSLPEMINAILGEGTWGKILEGLINALETIMAVIGVAIGLIIDLLPTLEQLAPVALAVFQAINQLRTAIVGFFTALLSNEHVVSAITSVVTALGVALAWLADKVAVAVTWLTTLVTSLTDRVSYSSAGETAGSSFSEGVANGASSGIQILSNVGQTLGTTLLSAFEDVLDINSPSKEGYKDGEFTVQGLADGMEANANKPVRAITKIGSSVQTEMEDTFSSKNGKEVAGKMVKGMTDTLSSVSDTVSNVDGIAASITPSDEEMVESGKSSAKTFAEGFSNVMGYLKEKLAPAVPYLKRLLTAIGDGLVNFVSTITPANVALFALCMAVIALVNRLTQGALRIGRAALQIGEAFTTVATSVSSWIGRQGRANMWEQVSRACLRIAIAIAILAFTASSNKEGLIFALEILGGIIAALTLLTFLTGRIGITGNAIAGTFRNLVTLAGFSMIITSFGVAIMFFATALLRLQNVSFDSLKGGLAGLGVALAELTVALAAVSFFATTGFWGITGLSLLVLAMGRFVTVMANLSSTISQLETSDIIKMAAVLYIVVGAIETLCLGLNLVGQYGRQLALVVLAVGVSLGWVFWCMGGVIHRVQTLTELLAGEEFLNAFRQTMIVVYSFLGYITGLIAAMIVLSIITQTMGLATVEVGAAMRGLIGTLSGFLWGLIALVAIFALIRTNPMITDMSIAIWIGAVTLAIAGLIGGIVTLVAYARLVPTTSLANVAAILASAATLMISIGGALGIVIAVCNLSAFGLGAIAGVTAMVTVTATVLAGIAALAYGAKRFSVNPTTLASIEALLLAASTFIISIGASIAVVVAVCSTAILPTQVAAITIAMTSMMLIIGEIGLLFAYLSNHMTGFNIRVDDINMLAVLFAGLCGLIVAIGVLIAITGHTNFWSCIGTMAILATMFTGFGYVVDSINRINVVSGDAILGDLIAIAGLLIAAVLSVAVLAAIPILQLLKGVAACIVLVASIAVLMEVLANLPSFNSGPTVVMIGMVMSLMGGLLGAILVCSILPLTMLAKGLVSMIIVAGAVAGLMNSLRNLNVQAGTSQAIISATVAVGVLGTLMAAMAVLTHYVGWGPVLIGLGTTLMALVGVIAVIREIGRVCSQLTVDVAKLYAVMSIILATGTIMAAMGFMAVMIVQYMPVWDDVARALAVITVIAGAMVGLMFAAKALTSTGVGVAQMYGAMSTILGIATALAVVIICCEQIAKLDWEQVAKACVLLVVIGGVLAGLIMAAMALSKTAQYGLIAAAIIAAIGIAILSTGVSAELLVDAFERLVKIDIASWADQLVSFLETLNGLKNWGGIMMGIAGVCLAFGLILIGIAPPVLVVAAAFTLASVGAINLANAAYRMGEAMGIVATNLESLITTFSSLTTTGVMTLFMVGGWMTYFGFCMIPFGIGLTLVGGGVVAVSLGIDILSLALYNVAMAFNVACWGINKISTLIQNLVNAVVAAIPTIIDSFANVIEKLNDMELDFEKLTAIAQIIYNFGHAVTAVAVGVILFGSGAIVCALGILAIAGALKVLMNVVGSAGTGDGGLLDTIITWVQRIAAVSPMIFLIGKMLKPLGHNLPYVGAGAVLCGAGLYIVGKAIDLIGTSSGLKPFEELITKGAWMAGAGGGLLVLGIGALVGSIGLLAFGGALAVLSYVTSLWGSTDAIDKFFKVFTENAGPLAYTGASLIALGLGAIVGGVGLVILGGGLTVCAFAMQQFPDGITGFDTFITTLTENAGGLAIAGASMLALAIGCAALAIPLILMAPGMLALCAALNMIPGGLTGFVEFLTALGDAGPGLLALASALGQLILVLTLGVIPITLGTVAIAALTAVLYLLTLVAPTVATGIVTIATAITTLTTAIVDAFNTIYTVVSGVTSLNLYSEGMTSAGDYVAGILEGLTGNSAVEGCATAAAILGTAIDEGFRGPDGIDAHSPSIKGFLAACFYGDGVHKGLQAGIDYLKEDAAESGNTMNEELVEMFTGKKATKLQTESGEEAAETTSESFWDKIKSYFSGEGNSSISEIWTKAKESITGLFNGDTSILEKLGLGSIADELSDITDEVDNVTTSTEAVTGTIEALSDTIEDQMSMFEEFDESSSISSDTLLSNMESQINGITNWAEGIETLGIRGMSAELIQYLADMGPEGYKYVKAFLEMTDEEFSEANDLYAQSLTLPDSAAETIRVGFEWAGVEIVESVAAGTYSAADTGEDAGEDLVDNVAEASYKQAKNNKTLQEAGIQAVYSFVKGLNEAKDSTSFDLTQLYGRYGTDFADGLYSMEDIVKTFYAGNWRDFASDLAQMGVKTGEFYVSGIDHALTAGEIIDKIYKDGKIVGGYMDQGACDELEIESPSRKAMETAGYYAEGLCIGMKKSLTSVYNSSAEMGDEAITGLQDSIYNISDMFGMDFDDTPTIRPVLDLSNINQGVANMNSLFGGQTVTANLNAINRGMGVKDTDVSELTKISQAMDKANQQYADRIVSALAKTDQPVTVQVNLEGDAAGVFRLVQNENLKATKASGVSPLMIMRNNVNNISRRTT